MATVLDLCTACMAHLTVEQSRLALEVLKEEYLEFYLKCCSYNRKIESAATSEELVSSEDDAVPYCKKQKMADKASRLRNSSQVSFGVPYSDTGHLSHLFEGGLSSSEEEEEEEEEDKNDPTESELIKQDRSDAVLEGGGMSHPPVD
eukprot:scaffold34837_cov35-Attheya_sp.AAC.1